MQGYLDAAGYGNRDISGGLTRFWLGSSLSGKTGSCDAGGGQRVGWFVGRQASPTSEYIFATRIVAADRGAPRGEGPDGLHARAISRAMLAALPAR